MNLFDDDLEKAAFFSGLKDLGITRLAAEYSGSGDSGGIDSVYGNNSETDYIPLEDFHDRVENLMYEILSTRYDYDWYNNDGGNGVIYFDINTLEYDVKGYVLETREAFQSGELDIDEIN